MGGQLSLFKSRRQRGLAPPPPPEFSTHVTLADLLKRWCHPDWLWTHLPLGEQREHQINPKTGKRFSITGQRLQRMGVNPGWPDFIFVGPQRRVLWLELKRAKTGRLSSVQDVIFERLQRCGFEPGIELLIVDRVELAVSWLQQHGVLPSTVRVQ